MDYLRIDQKKKIAICVSMRPQIFFDETSDISIRELVMANGKFKESQTMANDCSHRVQQKLHPTFLENFLTLVSKKNF